MLDCSQHQFKKILSTEYSIAFDDLRKNRMVVSFHKYGPAKQNYDTKLVNAITQLEARIKLYKETGNIELLVDVANFAMLEYMYSQHPNKHFDAEGHGTSMGTITYRDIEKL